MASADYAITHNLTPFISMQNHHSLIYREEEREMFPTLKVCTPRGSVTYGHCAQPRIRSISESASFRGALWLAAWSAGLLRRKLIDRSTTRMYLAGAQSNSLFMLRRSDFKVLRRLDGKADISDMVPKMSSSSMYRT
jgi:hypothetical protein